MTTTRLLATLFTSTLVLACTEAPDDVDTIASDLELENGGLDTADEAPEFGDAVFTRAALEGDATFGDPIDSDTEVARLRGLASASRLRVAMVWGQLPPDRDAPTARDWSGRIAISRGGLVVRRTIGFEDATDRVLARTERSSIDVQSVTRPFADGLVLEVLTDATDLSTVTLTYTSRDGAVTASAPLSALLEGPVSTDVGTDGNRIVVTAMRRADACDHGFMRGRWHALRRGLGRFVGVVNDSDGEPIGHLRGIWGARRNGERVLFAKYISRDGEFRGIFAGHYGDGEFQGRWLISTGDHGRAQGHYRESLPGPEVGGMFVGRWAETSCAADLPSP